MRGCRTDDECMTEAAKIVEENGDDERVRFLISVGVAWTVTFQSLCEPLFQGELLS